MQQAMQNFDYKSYQMRAANAATIEEKAAINQELKYLYDGLAAEDKKAFDKGLDAFLKAESQRLKSDYEAIKTMEN